MKFLNNLLKFNMLYIVNILKIKCRNLDEIYTNKNKKNIKSENMIDINSKEFEEMLQDSIIDFMSKSIKINKIFKQDFDIFFSIISYFFCFTSYLAPYYIIYIYFFNRIYESIKLLSIKSYKSYSYLELIKSLYNKELLIMKKVNNKNQYLQMILVFNKILYYIVLIMFFTYGFFDFILSYCDYREQYILFSLFTFFIWILYMFCKDDRSILNSIFFMIIFIFNNLLFNNFSKLSFYYIKKVYIIYLIFIIIYCIYFKYKIHPIIKDRNDKILLNNFYDRFLL